MATIIVPVGFSNGPSWNPDPDVQLGAEPDCYEIILGYGTVSLQRESFLTWVSAFADIDVHSKLELTRDRLIQTAGSMAGVLDAGRRCGGGAAAGRHRAAGRIRSGCGLDDRVSSVTPTFPDR
ncbi:hypothetical protein [Fodinicola feengrottensis]|uniref:hypothetical protein n=1 Tax=Fodinicola feengrottensis TaxID=435914 RepID=UPI0013CF63D1|nr:hypothetical protein [Fodinicola feengrottensis]